MADSWRNLAITLSSVDSRYWPLITRVLSHDADAWRAYNQSFEPAEALRWAGLTMEQVAEQAERLRATAATVDVLGPFYDLVRRARPQAWANLRGDALVAADLRIAAEVLDCFADDLGRTPPSFDESLGAQRLSARPRSTDAVLTSLGLSPHPSLVIGVEGATELLLVPRVFERLGLPLESDWIRIEDFGGSDRDLTLLAHFASAPVPGDDRGAYVPLDRPITRFLVLVNAEKKYATLEKRRAERGKLLDAIAARLSADLRADLYAQSARFVEIRTWGPLPFEFAHFTDRQLAAILQSAAATPHPSGMATLVHDIEVQRRASSPNIAKVFARQKWPGARLSKPGIADASWPSLERRLDRAVARGTKGPPIMKAVLRAWELATLTPRSGMALRRRHSAGHQASPTPSSAGPSAP